MTLPEGTFLEGRYRLDKLLSQGGMGTIYKAFDTKLQVAVAIKENFLQTPQAIEQFEQEALILARLQHSNLPRVSDHFTFNQQQYLVMDFIEGRDLWDLVEANGGPLDERITLGYILQVCDAVSYLHRQDPPILHRDIKPQNIKITPDGRAVLVDFGIAKVITADGRTYTGAQAATPGFSPPEQYGGVGTTPRSDVYSLGATLYAVLTGEYPPDSISLLSNAEVFRPARAVNRRLSRQVSVAIEQAMHLRQQDRPEAVVDWMRDLKAILAGNGVSSRRPKDDTAQLTSQMRMTEPVPVALPPTAPIERQRPMWWWFVLAGLALVMASSVTAFIVGQGRGDNTSDTEALLIALVASATAQAQAGAIDNTGPDLAATLVSLAATATSQTQLQIELARPTETPTLSPTATPIPSTPTPTFSPTAAAIAPTRTPATPTAILPSATPRSQRIAFVSNRAGSNDIFVTNLDGGELLNLTKTNDWHETSPTWSPDGQQLAFAVTNITESPEIINSSIRTVSASGGPITGLTTQAGDPAWSPDGEHLALAAVDNYISLFEIETGQSMRLTPGVGYRSAWSPDGLQVAFDNNVDIFTLNATGDNLRRVLSSSADEIEPAWSPDGQRLAFASNGEGNWEIYIIDIDGSNGVRLTNHPADDRQPTWSPDGTQLAFTSNRTGNSDIYVMNLDGSNVINVTRHPAEDTQPVWAP